MPRLDTVLLRHETSAGSHYDWLLDRPATSEGPVSRLWTARTGWPSWFWVAAGQWQLQVIGDHRREFLDYEGDLTSGRGTVKRVDSGSFDPLLWTADRIVVDLAMGACRGPVQLDRFHGDCWKATLDP